MVLKNKNKTRNKKIIFQKFILHTGAPENFLAGGTVFKKGTFWNEKTFSTSVFFKVWLEEPLSNFEKPLIFFLLFLSILSFVYTIVVAIAVPAQKILGGQ